MSKSERKWSTVLDMLFMYLAISKVLYIKESFYDKNS